MTTLRENYWLAPSRGWTRSDYQRQIAANEAAAALAAVPSSDTPVMTFIRAIGRPPAWQRDALCREYPEIDFFAGETAAAKAVCVRCLVRDECLAAGQNGREKGTWGGTSEGERTALRRATAA